MRFGEVLRNWSVFGSGTTAHLTALKLQLNLVTAALCTRTQRLEQRATLVIEVSLEQSLLKRLAALPDIYNLSEISLYEERVLSLKVS